jgi:hypothetical protein
MTLIEELRSDRDYWLVPIGDLEVGINDILKVQKGANDVGQELSMAETEAQMAEALGDPELADRLRPFSGLNLDQPWKA